MGKAQGKPFEPDFDRSIKVQCIDQRLSSDAGGILLRDADYRLGLVDSIAQSLLDPRDPAAFAIASMNSFSSESAQ